MTDESLTVTSLQSQYYSALLKKYGDDDVKSVASGNPIAKSMRYQQLSGIFSQDVSFTLHDVGFGLGHYYEFIKEQFPGQAIAYSGSEVTREFVTHCREKYPDLEFLNRDLSSGPFDETYDYFIFAGTFYHSAGACEADFKDWLKAFLINCFANANRGMAFNMVTSYVEYQKDDLFYFDLGELLNFVISDLSRFFEIHHASPLYEHTIYVYKQDYIASVNPQSEFDRYFSR